MCDDIMCKKGFNFYVKDFFTAEILRKYCLFFSANENAPKEKSYNRVDCCLCPNQTTTKHINRLFSPCEKKKDIIDDIQLVLNIKIESNHNSPGICRTCTRFLPIFLYLANIIQF